jgi:hypothetical protein
MNKINKIIFYIIGVSIPIIYLWFDVILEKLSGLYWAIGKIIEFIFWLLIIMGYFYGLGEWYKKNKT